MVSTAHDHGYGIKWKDVYVDRRERYHTSVTDFHEHTFYEIHLILSGNVKVFLKGQTQDGCNNKLVILKPFTTHFITCKPDVLYSSLYLVFTEEFISSFIPEYRHLLSVFGDNGRILMLTDTQKETLQLIIQQIDQESNAIRKKLLVMLVLSYINEYAAYNTSPYTQTPDYILETLLYVDEHYAEKIVAKDLAQRFFIGRTTLMTTFKSHVGCTLHEYIDHIRLKSAIDLLERGVTEEQAAEKCGFNDTSGLIRCFKKHYNSTPKRYLKQQNNANTRKNGNK